MKNLILLLVFLGASSVFVQAQTTVNGININTIKVKYCKFYTHERINKCIIRIDYGQENQKDKAMTLMENGRPKLFNSEIDALNFMLEHGWEYLNDYITISEGNLHNHYYLLKKKG